MKKAYNSKQPQQIDQADLDILLTVMGKKPVEQTCLGCGRRLSVCDETPCDWGHAIDRLHRAQIVEADNAQEAHLPEGRK